MSLVVLEDVTLFFADRLIFDEVSVRLGAHDRVGLVGPNGSGKTTLLKVIAGVQEIDDGKVVKAKGIRIGWLPQDLALAGGKTLRDFVVGSVPGRRELGDELAAVEAELTAAGDDPARHDDLGELAERVAELHERQDHFDRFFSEHEALAILAGLGFATSDLDRDLGELSGGWKMRAVLAALLFQRPDVLLLDEPTNHLDMPSVAWFADFLKRYDRCFVLISHDREFLNEQIGRVLSLEPEGLRSYPGNYERYVEARLEEETILEGRARNLERQREHLEKFIERFRYKASKAAAVQSRIKMLDKLDDVETFQKRQVMRFSFPPTDRTVAEVLKLDGVRKAYGARVVLQKVDLTVRRGERIGIIGVNGAGKTTLLRMIAGELPLDGGAIRVGQGVKVGYYAQHHADTLDLGATVLEVVQRASPTTPLPRVRSILGAFMFGGDDVDKPIKVLSGGERARVALARLLVNPGNLMLMDEPTNHLDLESADSLAKSLTTYDGTLVFVSHNRSLIRTLATRIWNVEDGKVETYPGTLDEYLYSCAQRRVAVAAADTRTAGKVMPGTSGARESAAAPRDNTPPVSAQADRDRKRREAELRQRRAKQLGPLEKQVAQLEERIAALEAAQSTRSAELADPAVYADETRRRKLLGDYQSDQAKLEDLTGRWEHAAGELEEAKRKFDAES
ncbi:MAG TPA: ABC-F family ATP-binding cassette domain-containing protein [Kofleriaceae bacterium]|nr:ABC-F family ATP-binding cassette domain-containing protein [Kofleriaceae bacterium]